MKQNEWAALAVESDARRRTFGTGVPVEIIAADPETSSLCDVVKQLASGEPLHAFVLGTLGSGKSMFVSAGAAALEAAGVEYAILNPDHPSAQGEYFRNLDKTKPGPVVLIDDCDIGAPLRAIDSCQ